MSGKIRTNNFRGGPTLQSHETLCRDLGKMTSFENELDKFGKEALTLFIVFILNIEDYKKALFVLSQLEKTVVGRDAD